MKSPFEWDTDPLDLFISFVFWFAVAGALCLAVLFASWMLGYGPWSPERYKAEQESNARKLHYIQRIAEGYQEVPESAR